jgi:hypothetical protein
MPLTYSGDVPQLDFVTTSGDAPQPSWIELYRDGVSLSLGWGRTPLAGFSDRDRMFVLFGRDEQANCASNNGKDQHCPNDPDMGCSTNAGTCLPLITAAQVCDGQTQEGCDVLQACFVQTPGYCTDKSNSLYKTGDHSELFAVMDNLDLAVQRPSDPQKFDSVFVFATSKFRNASARSVRKFTGHLGGNDYRPGQDAVFFWGRPAWWAERGQQASLYLMMQRLPIAFDGRHARFEPQYFAGVDPNTGEPSWSSHQVDAKPLALDGKVDGSPHEQLIVINQMAISWLGAPINKWVMIYGGDQTSNALVDPQKAEWPEAPGAVAMRFADHPWGPWTTPKPHLLTGSPKKVGDNFGPGGELYHYDCKDKAPARCARTDPVRPFEAFIPGCPAPDVEMDIGHFYSANIIDEYTARNGDDGLDVIWNISAWNPYKVILLKTTIRVSK